jgi:hypothetical protein
MTKLEARIEALADSILAFDIRASFVIRHLAFVIPYQQPPF